MPNFFSAKYMFAMVPANRAVHNKENLQEKLIHLNVKARPPVTWFIDIMRQTLKCTKASRSFQSYIRLIVHQNVY